MTSRFMGRGNQYIQLVKVLYCKLPTIGKQLATTNVPGFEPPTTEVGGKCITTRSLWVPYKIFLWNSVWKAHQKIKHTFEKNFCFWCYIWSEVIILSGYFVWSPYVAYVGVRCHFDQVLRDNAPITMWGLKVLFPFSQLRVPEIRNQIPERATKFLCDQGIKFTTFHQGKIWIQMVCTVFLHPPQLTFVRWPWQGFEGDTKTQSINQQSIGELINQPN